MPRFKTFKRQVKLSKGQALKFAAGKGYFAGAPQKPDSLPIPKDPLAPWGDRLIQQEGGKRVSALYDPQEKAIRSRGAAEAAALAAAGEAGARILRESADVAQAPYQQASAATQQLAGGFSGAMTDRLTAAQVAAAEFAKTQGVPAYTSPVDIQASGDAAYSQGTYIPGSALQKGGADAAASANRMVGVQALSTQADVRGRVKQTDDELIELASKRPELRQQVMDELFQREREKFQASTQRDAQQLYREQFGLEKVKTRADIAHDVRADKTAAERARISNKNYQLAVKRHALAVKKAEKEGHGVDAAASKGLGKLVDDEGQPILDKNGKEIPFKTGGAGKVPPGVKAYRQAVPEARQIRGEPVENDSRTRSTPGRYIAKPGAKGVFPGMGGLPATTNDPNKAERDSEFGSFNEAQAYIMEAYGLNKAQARRALVAAGWKPDGQRPKKKKEPRGGRR